MKVLVLGSGGREHAFVWKIRQSDRVKKIFCAPGNGGTDGIAQNVNIPVSDIRALADFAWENKVDMTFVGPESPLVDGIVDLFNKKGLHVFGPTAYCAQLEGSKIFAKRIIQNAGVATANFEAFDNSLLAKQSLENRKFPCVIKADGLAAGKGVIIASNIEEANLAIDKIMQQKIFGSAGDKILVEDFLEGKEVSVITLVDGNTVVPLVPSRDYKRSLDNDAGSNTGGMGAYSSDAFIEAGVLQNIIKRCVQPVVDSLKDQGHHYKGILYAGMMLTTEGPKILEFNVRSGDPETQVILPRMKNDFVEVAISVLENKLSSYRLESDTCSCVTVCACSGGYPDSYSVGKQIFGLSDAEKLEDVIVFHAGTKKNKHLFSKDEYYTAGGRVLNVTSYNRDITKARENVYNALELIKFDGMHYRKDVALEVEKIVMV